MAIVTITVNGKTFQLACNDGEEARLKTASEKLNVKIDHLRVASSMATTELLLIMCALDLQDEVCMLQSKLEKIGGQEDGQVAKALSEIAVHLENLAQKISG